MSIGSGEWLLGPLGRRHRAAWTGDRVRSSLVSALLQVFYNIEISPLRAGHRRGADRSASAGSHQAAWLWIHVLADRCCSTWPSSPGGWATGGRPGAVRAASTGEVPTAPRTRTTVDAGWPSCCWLVVMGITMVSAARSPADAGAGQPGLLIVIQLLVTLIIAALVLVPLSAVWWRRAASGCSRPALPPEGSRRHPDLGGRGRVHGPGVRASTGTCMNHYRDKGYGMGSRAGYIPSRLARREATRSGGRWHDLPGRRPKNAARWQPLDGGSSCIEMWVVFVARGPDRHRTCPVILVQLHRASRPATEADPGVRCRPIVADASSSQDGRGAGSGTAWALLVGLPHSLRPPS